MNAVQPFNLKNVRVGSLVLRTLRKGWGLDPPASIRLELIALEAAIQTIVDEVMHGVADDAMEEAAAEFVEAAEAAEEAWEAEEADDSR